MSAAECESPPTKRRKVKAAAEPSRHATEAQRELQRTKAEQLWAMLLNWGDRGTGWTTYMGLSKELREECRIAFFGSMVEEVPYATIAASVRAYRRWKGWCGRNRHSEKEPAALVVTLFLRSLRARGPTAPHGVYTGLRFLQTHIGLPF